MEQSESNRRESFSLLSVAFILIIVLCVLIIGGVLLDDYFEELRIKEAATLAHKAEHDQTVRTFPHKLTIYNKTAYLSSVDFLELYGNHSYTGYVIITIDRGQLTDDDMHWILKGKRYDWELDAHATWWPSGTDADSESLHFLGCHYTESHIYFLFYTDPQRQSLKGTKFYVSLEYLQDGADFEDRYYYSYLADFTGSNYHDGTDFLPVETLKILAEAMIDAAS